MDTWIEGFKVAASVLGVVLAGLALIIQRIKENKEVDVHAEASLSEQSRKWLEEFRVQLVEAKREVEALRKQVSEDNAALAEMRGKLSLLAKENLQLRKEVARLRRENAELREQLNRLESNGGFHV